jgi:serine beta-lactamase-like protein LACTB, mitochondrial
MKRNGHEEESGLKPCRPTRILIACVGLLLAVPFVVAQDAKVSTDERGKLEDTVSRFMASNSVPGLSAAVVQNGEYLWSAGFGMADLENFVPATAETLYRLASVSKPLTAVGAMELWERGKLDLDAPVQKYCPAFPEKKEGPITTREALGHIAGIRHYKSDAEGDPEVYNVRHFDDPIAAGVRFFADDPLVAKPGTYFHYSTHGYTLVGCVMEGASGEKYVPYMHANVFLPAGMAETQADDRYAIITHRTRFYQKDKAGKIVNADFLDSSYKIPGGGWLSSAQDMAKFEVAVLNDRLIRRATRDLMWTPLKPSDGSEDTYALGWGSAVDAGVAEVGHSGGQQGTSTAIFMAPDRKAGVVVLINMEEVPASTLAKELLQVVLAASK